MRVAVVACAGCRRVQAAELRFAQVKCVGCRKAIDLGGAKAFYRGESEAEARAVVQRVAAQREGMGIEDYARLLASQEKESPGSIEDVLASLSSREFSMEDFSEEMGRFRVNGDRRRSLLSLTGENRIYEPRPGRFRVL